ncbi:protein STRUBBELIG-RECEPTOR FAMILY 7-like isoform X7 [Solanum stenotomum]|uniref:protein STRUBBELIG-RECEPTOR FAMILY 7-like isoform X6 n=1 Tax=Solanum stenotomum TaxID=172797 RepID=UPI0020CFFD0A|nr:protein STRUBBELIG-RECEPTOR FAMILY 7-like isoform X6 [Solanum stenotomum]XP_049397641.1 protein STRUBBELIG-RECEPTOR FAMILY 7-like isoform X7 [Solanum stenotomum]
MRLLLLLAVVLLVAILVNFSSFVNGDTDPSDASVLRVLYTTLNSPGQLTKWSANGGDPCGESWTGITCSGNKVSEIQISGLGLSGSLGSQLDSLKSVTNFDISNNKMGSQLPNQLPPNVQRLNLASCGFSGGLPYSISQMTSLQSLNVSHNQIQGSVVVSFDSLSALNTLDFSFNSMTGNLPQSFQSLTSMNKMYLQNNQFSGTIDVLANLPLGNLNVENNQFTGWIPDQLKGIVQSNGNLWISAPAPPPPPGTPPANNPNGDHKSRENSSNSGSRKSGIGGGGVAGIVISILVVGAIVAFFIIKKRSRRSSTDLEKLDKQPLAPLTSQKVEELKPYQTSSAVRMGSFETPTAVTLRPPPIDRVKSFDEVDMSPKPIVPPKKINTAQIRATQFSIADLQIATDSFNVENLIGEGSIGRVYCAQFDDGKVLAVKKINSSALQNHEDFLNIVSETSQLHHPNIIELVGYCSEHGQYLLVHEFHKNGSLHDFLHLSDEDSKPLAWNSRVKIALGAARALEYLHEVHSPSLVHKNIKSANILLDLELNPHLSDSGLACLINDADQALNHNTGSGYGAPEVAMYGQCTIKSDVYSFGVVMLELLTGRTPFDSERPRSEQSLVRWATPQLHDIDALAKMVDPALKGLYPVKSISRFADVIALCVQPEPEFRPPMSEVVEALVRLVQRANMSKRTYSIDRGSRGETDAQDNQP